MSTSPLLKLASQKLWERRRAHYFAVFRLALMLLRERSSLPEGELDLNREYRFAVSTACRRLDPLGQFGRPVFEAQSPPDPDAETMQPHEWKRPDAQWLHDDPAAPDERHCEKSFFVEFKRLGSPTPTRRDLNEEYISHGVERFRSLEHRYGMHMSEGLMIAYLQSMGLQAVYAEVCRHAVAMKFPPLVLAASGWQPKGVTELFHHFERDFPLISPFGLRHFWVDIQ